MTRDGLGEAIHIRYDGLDAERHEIEISALAESLRGLSRIIGACGTFAATERVVRHRDVFAVRVVVSPPEANCFEFSALVKLIGEQPYLSATAATLTATLIGYVIKSAVGAKEEMKHLRGALEYAIKEHGGRQQAVVDALLGTIDKLAGSLKPSVRHALSPIGETASSLTISDSDRSNLIRVGQDEKDYLMREDELMVDEERTYKVKISQLDLESGGCKLRLDNDKLRRYTGKIMDPLLKTPNNRYVMAMAAKEVIAVRAKAVLKDGEIDELFISDVEQPSVM
jgi:hypothetical protein